MTRSNTLRLLLEQTFLPALAIALLVSGVLTTVNLQADEVPVWEDDSRTQDTSAENSEEPSFAIELTLPKGQGPNMFSFTLSRRTTVHFETRGTMDTYGQLLDEEGLDLAADDNGGRDSNFRIVKTLEPGRYWLGVEAEGLTTSYILLANLGSID